MNTDDYVSYPIALALKKAGFDEPCHYGYSVKMRLEPELSFGEPKMVHSKTPKNYNDNRKGIAKGLEFCSAVPLWQAQKWLREKKGYDVALCPEGEFLKTERTYRHTGWNYSIIRISKIGIMTPGPIGNVLMSKYEQALSEGIKSALELINTEDHNHE